MEIGYYFRLSFVEHIKFQKLLVKIINIKVFNSLGVTKNFKCLNGKGMHSIN